MVIVYIFKICDHRCSEDASSWHMVSSNAFLRKSTGAPFQVARRNLCRNDIYSSRSKIVIDLSAGSHDRSSKRGLLNQEEVLKTDLHITESGSWRGKSG
jgi:hypothetical protein